MEMLVHIGWLVLGLVLLSFGADWLVRGSSEIALRLGIQPLIIGLTVVAFGTSAPELIVSLKANLDPNTEADIAVGNVIGSNICNIALMLGLAAVLRPFRVASQVVKSEVPILLVVTAVFVAMIWDGSLGRLEGGILTLGIVAYLLRSFWVARRHPEDPAVMEMAEETQAVVGDPCTSSIKTSLKSIGWVMLGFVSLVYGADRLVTSGVAVAVGVGVPQVVIGLTLVALGTSLPELATTVAAVRRRETDLIAGNVIGSNLFNILAVMGIVSLIKPMQVMELQHRDLLVMAGFTLILLPVMKTGMRINRIEGALLLIAYAIYCVFVVKPEWFGV